jgi:hypothetical protein
MPDFTPEQWNLALDRAQCPGANHQGQTVIVHSPGFFDNGGLGTSCTACAACIEDVTAVITSRYGAAVLHRPRRS